MRKFVILIFLLFFGIASAQELNCRVSVNYAQLGATNTQVFKTLEKSLTDFINKTDWTGQAYKPNERINCSMFINITAAAGSSFTATLQVQSQRPVFNSTYNSPILNFNDKDFNFDYTEFQNLTFNPQSFDSNLISVISYYSYMIIGMDADTFTADGGRSYLETAQEIVSVAQTGGYKGWSGSDGMTNRFFLVNDMLSNTYEPFREALFQYHFQGLDNMTTDLKASKETIKTAISKLSELHKVRPNAFLTRVFFDSKSDEIVSIFSGGPQVNITDLVDNLNRVSPLNAAKWTNIKL